MTLRLHFTGNITPNILVSYSWILEIIFFFLHKFLLNKSLTSSLSHIFLGAVMSSLVLPAGSDKDGELESDWFSFDESVS